MARITSYPFVWHECWYSDFVADVTCSVLMAQKGCWVAPGQPGLDHFGLERGARET